MQRTVRAWVAILVQIVGVGGVVQQIAGAFAGRSYNLEALLAFGVFAGAPTVLGGYFREYVRRQIDDPPERQASRRRDRAGAEDSDSGGS